MFKQYKWQEVVTAYAFLLMALLLAVLFIVLPIGKAINYSFTDYYLLKPHERQFIGFDNYQRIFTDDLFRKTFLNTVKFVVFVVPIQLTMALVLALIVNRKVKGVGFFRTAYFSPAVLSLVVISILWTVLLNPDSGLINEVLTALGLSPQPFLTSSSQAMYTIVMISAWSGCGYQMMIFLAGLSNIDSSQYEAAELDGCGSLRKFRYITLPGLKPITMFLVITTTIQAFKLIVQPMVMTGGGPDYSTMTILQYIYEYGYRHRNIGYASAITVVFTVFLIVVSVLIKKLFREEKA
ncbi:permease component of ABC-type sugar transporter [Thermobacillus composti KWC4]|uniref:Permease component of ABC-type sugar transporter n=1 Tax=Thermobacillus composti (strain DSM 18247 / JCM 13945 / KWC4) TaxID=717605 RepID=L0EAS5_THECK|nr:sugar ABC transporter permease [Thermobacillus composti]AGA56801.1 permease component of ABC-type sugar transporter [Thermobacillus composti KWC4]